MQELHFDQYNDYTEIVQSHLKNVMSLINFRARAIVLFAALVMSFPFSAQAIVNVEQAIIGQPDEGVQTTLSLLANGASGNTENSSASAEMLSLWQHQEHTEFLQVQYAHGKSRGIVDTNRAFAHVRHRTSISPGWAVEGFLQTGRDTFARLAQRFLFGGGIRKVLFEQNGKAAGYLGFGAFREHETLNSLSGTTDSGSTQVWRASTYLVLKYQVNEQVRLFNTTYYQPAMSETRDNRILDQAAILVKMGENLDMKLSLDFSFDSRPPQGVRKKDIFYSTGLELSF